MYGSRGISKWLAAAAAAAVLTAGCGQQPDWPGWTGRGRSEPGDSPAPAGAGRNAGADAEGNSFAILLSVFRDPATHVEDAKLYQEKLEKEAKWKDLFIIHKAGHSELYWGRYLTPAEARKNLMTAKAHTTPAGTKPFARAMVMPLPGEDIGPPDWNLKNARGAYTYLVAVFKDDPERRYIGRKKFAVNYCQRLREGEYEGYFYHGVADSWVTIGTFGAEAVREEMTPAGRIVEILNARMKAIRDDFPHLAINGTGVNELAWDPVNRKMIRIPQKTRPIRIPRGK